VKDELGSSYLWAMREGNIVVFPSVEEGSKQAHSMGFKGQAVEGAGMIVADYGKIVAIDNRSGHYFADARALAPAVNKIHQAGAFHKHASVGLILTDKQRLLLPVESYRKLASANFSRPQVMQVMNDLTKRFPNGPKDFFNPGGQFTYLSYLNSWDKWKSEADSQSKSKRGVWHYVGIILRKKVK